MTKVATKQSETEITLSDEIAALESAGIIPANTPPAQIKLFTMMCQMSGLNPLKKEAYLIPTFAKKEQKWKYHVVVAIGGQRKIAANTKSYAGCDEPLYDEGLSAYAFIKTGRGVPTSCKYTVYKIIQGHRVPFTAEVLFKEYTTGSNLWHPDYGKPLTMISKVAEGHALRKAFPEELGAYYIEEEIEVADSVVKDLQSEVTRKSEAATQAVADKLKKGFKEASGQPESEDAEEVVTEVVTEEAPVKDDGATAHPF